MRGSVPLSSEKALAACAAPRIGPRQVHQAREALKDSPVVSDKANARENIDVTKKKKNSLSAAHKPSIVIAFTLMGVFGRSRVVGTCDHATLTLLAFFFCFACQPLRRFWVLPASGAITHRRRTPTVGCRTIPFGTLQSCIAVHPRTKP